MSWGLAQAGVIGLGGLATAVLAVCGIFKIRDEIIKASIDRKGAEAAARKAEAIAANPDKASKPCVCSARRICVGPKCWIAFSPWVVQLVCFCVGMDV